MFEEGFRLCTSPGGPEREPSGGDVVGQGVLAPSPPRRGL